ncbi:hypothetical protein GW17_00047806 [Ensete ventricosum]|nr:hypothetical protein GW17_00047806 [Ensete ventricosum]
MAYVDHAFSISDEDVMMGDSSRAIQNRPPVKEIAFAVSLLVFGSLAIVIGSVMAANRVGGDRAHGRSAETNEPSNVTKWLKLTCRSPGSPPMISTEPSGPWPDYKKSFAVDRVFLNSEETLTELLRYLAIFPQEQKRSRNNTEEPVTGGVVK